MGVETIDYEKLIEPYAAPSEGATRANKRTASGQRLWLVQRGFPEPIVDEAMRVVYNEILMGRVFTEKEGDSRPAGYWLDRCLLETCRDLMRQSHAGALRADPTQLEAINSFTRKTVLYAWVQGVLVGAVAGSALGGVVLWLLIR